MEYQVERVINYKRELLIDRMKHIQGLRCVGVEVEMEGMKLIFSDPFGTKIVVMKISPRETKVEVKEWIKKKIQ